MLQCFGVAQCCLVEQVLQCPTVVKTSAQLGHEFIGNVNGEAAALDSTVKNMAGVLLAFEASFAVLADASGTTKTERSQSGRPKGCSLLLEPSRNISGEFSFGMHDVYVPYNTYTVKRNLSNVFNTVVCEFRDRN